MRDLQNENAMALSLNPPFDFVGVGAERVGAAGVGLAGAGSCWGVLIRDRERSTGL